VAPVSRDRSVTVVGAPRLVTGVIERRRLTDQLQGDAPLTVVRGPGGSGKTVLVADWVAQTGPRGVWVTVDSATATRETLWGTIGRRLLATGSVPEDIDLARIGESLRAVNDVRALLRRSFENVPAPFLLVLDDFQVIRDAETVAEDLVDLLVNCPHLKVIVLSRYRTPLEGSMVAARVDLVRIVPPDLSLTLAEAHDVITSVKADIPIDVAAMHNASGGNPLLLRALVLGHGASPPEESETEEVARSIVVDLLYGTLRQWRAFMLRTSIPEAFDVALAQRLAGSPDAAEQLEALEAQGVLMRSGPAPHALYRYHPMLREVLLDKAREQLGAELIDLDRSVAYWSMERGTPETAIAHAVAAHDLNLVSKILLRDGVALLTRNGAYPHLAHLPVQEVVEYPLVAFAIALGANGYRRSRRRAEQYFHASVLGARQRAAGAGPADRVVLACIEAISLRVTRRPSQGVHAARRALRLMQEEGAALESLRDQIVVLRVQCALTLLRAGLLSEARAALQENEAYLGTMPVAAALSTISTEAALHALEGDMEAVAETISLVEDGPWPASIREDYPGAGYRLAQAVQALERFDIDGLRRYATTGVPHLDALDLRPYFVAVQVLADLFDGQPRLGPQRIERYLARSGRRRLTQPDRRILVPVLALLHLCAGRIGPAEQALASLPESSSTALLLKALCAHVTADHPAVVNLITRLGDQDLNPRLEVAAYTIAAASALRFANTGPALDALQKMAAVMVNNGLRFHLALIPHCDLRALGELAGRHRLNFVRDCLDPDGVPEIVPASASKVSLTERERVVLHALLRTGRLAQIADQLVVSPNTVKSQMRSLYRKLGVAGRQQALTVAYDLGLLEHDPSMGEAADA